MYDLHNKVNVLPGEMITVSAPAEIFAALDDLEYMCVLDAFSKALVRCTLRFIRGGLSGELDCRWCC